MLDWLRQWWNRFFGGPPVPVQAPPGEPSIPPAGVEIQPVPERIGPEQIPLTPDSEVGVGIHVIMACQGKWGAEWTQWVTITVNVPATRLLSDAIEQAKEWVLSGGAAMRYSRSCPHPEIVSVGVVVLSEKPFDNPALSMS